MIEEFYRIKRLPPYVFAEVNALKARARAAGEDIIDFGMGNPDQPPPAARHRQAGRDGGRTRGSTAIPPRAASRACASAIAGYYERRFGVEPRPGAGGHRDPRLQGGLANLCQAITSPGDIILVPNPSYPIHAFGFIIAGAAIRSMPVGLGYDFMEQLERAVRHSVPKPTCPGAELSGQPDRAGGRPGLLCCRSWTSAATTAST